jgi:glycosyltransferase involved in cell wall biosynthesis
VRWALLDPNPAAEDYTLRQLRLALQRRGASVAILRLVQGGQLLQPGDLEALLKSWKPDRIVWCNVKGLPYFEILAAEFLRHIPKIALWFDEPVSALEKYGLIETFQNSGARTDFIHAVWDGYWRELVHKRYGVQTKAIHLAADEFEFHPDRSADVRRRNLFNDNAPVTFIGMLHSPAKINERVAAFPLQSKALYRQVEEHCLQLTVGGKPIPSWHELINLHLNLLGEKQRTLLRMQLERSPELLSELRWCVWALGKNQVRIRLLKAILQTYPIQVFAEQQQLDHASAMEWNSLLGESKGRFTLYDTSSLSAEDLGVIQHYGKVHVQATDPQSVRGGIPYRVFQTAASGGCLLTDIKPELSECFQDGFDFAGYETLTEMSTKLTRLISDPDQREALGRQARQTFESRHTWSHRLDLIESWIHSTL